MKPEYHVRNESRNTKRKIGGIRDVVVWACVVPV
jgi:hypothetical protein